MTNQNYGFFFGNNGATTSLKINGSQGLIFNFAFGGRDYRFRRAGDFRQSK